MALVDIWAGHPRKNREEIPDEYQGRFRGEITGRQQKTDSEEMLGRQEKTDSEEILGGHHGRIRVPHTGAPSAPSPAPPTGYRSSSAHLRTEYYADHAHHANPANNELPSVAPAPTLPAHSLPQHASSIHLEAHRPRSTHTSPEHIAPHPPRPDHPPVHEPDVPVSGVPISAVPVLEAPLSGIGTRVSGVAVRVSDVPVSGVRVSDVPVSIALETTQAPKHSDASDALLVAPRSIGGILLDAPPSSLNCKLGNSGFIYTTPCFLCDAIALRECGFRHL